MDTPTGEHALLEELRARMATAQQLANMGDYDWHVPSDTNRWSDQLYRIFGYEPQSRPMDYATYLEHVHPDDREETRAVQQRAYMTGEAFQMTHRIIRAGDGEVRHLACNGEAVKVEGTTVMLRGTAVDITERVLAEEASRLDATRLAQARLRRQKAAEINDLVIQGITSALYHLELGDEEKCRANLQRTLTAAQGILTDLVSPSGNEGELVRSRPAVFED